MRRALLYLLVGSFAIAPAFGQAEEGVYSLELAFPKLFFDRPVDIQHAGDGLGRLFVVEQEGVIRVFENQSSVSRTDVFLDIRDRVRSAGGEEGLLGLAFHPNFESTGWFFVNYTASNPRRTVISRFAVREGEENQADPTSELVILEAPQPFGNHNGGQLRFGPDGYLYIAFGDGGSGGDPQENAQNLSNLLGSIARIDIDNPEANRNYGIPADNPFLGALCGPLGCRDEIYAYGLRNPWRFSFDRDTGDLWTGDVGQNGFEEINVVVRGGNYGWDIMEATHCFEPPTGCDTSGLELPVWEYGRSEGASITGGFVYRGEETPGLVGAYIYGDFVSGRIWALQLSEGGEPENTELLDTSLFIATFGEDEAGDVYIGAFDGRIYRLVEEVDTRVEDPMPALKGTLISAFPNPFDVSTRIRYSLPHEEGDIRLSVFDVLGRKVRAYHQGRQGPGTYQFQWDGIDENGTPVPVGLYVIQVNGESENVGWLMVVKM